MFCTGWFLIYFSLCDSENDLKFAMRFVQPNFNPLSNVANAFGNNYSALHFQQVEKRCNAFSMHFSTHFQCIFDLSLMLGFRKFSY